MSAEVRVALVPSTSSTPAASRETVQSIRADVGEAVSIVAYEEHPALQVEGVTRVSPQELVQAGPIIAFARPGDRWREGAFAARLRTFAANQDAGLSVAGYVLVDADGKQVLTVKAPMPPLHPAELLLRPRTEPSAVLVRSALLDPLALQTIIMPNGDAVIWNRIAQEHGLLPSGELAAEVPLDADRHGYSPAAATTALLEMLSLVGSSATDVGPEMRRELLRRLYLEPDEGLVQRPDLVALLPEPDESSAAVIADLQWALERQAEALRAERVRWPGWVAGREEDDGPTELAEQTIQELGRDVDWLHTEVARRDATSLRLAAEIERRDAIIAQLRAAMPGSHEAQSR